MICDTCARTFGNPSSQIKHEYDIHQCILCGGSHPLTIRLKPLIAAARVLSIDGGGTRVVILLTVLEIL
jgi:hypothetical protein